jgi:hypothetical protein
MQVPGFPVGRSLFSNGRFEAPDGSPVRVADRDTLSDFLLAAHPSVAEMLDGALGRDPMPGLRASRGAAVQTDAREVPGDEAVRLCLRYVAAVRRGDPAAGDDLATLLGWVALAFVADPDAGESDPSGLGRFLLRHAWAADGQGRAARMAREVRRAFPGQGGDPDDGPGRQPSSLVLSGSHADLLANPLATARALGADVACDGEDRLALRAAIVVRAFLPLPTAAAQADIDRLMDAARACLSDGASAMEVGGRRWRVHAVTEHDGRRHVVFRAIPMQPASFESLFGAAARRAPASDCAMP